MSRAPPFPVNSNRPRLAGPNGNYANGYYSGPDGPGPSSGSVQPQRSAASQGNNETYQSRVRSPPPIGNSPLRPQRSELRTRQISQPSQFPGPGPSPLSSSTRGQEPIRDYKPERTLTSSRSYGDALNQRSLADAARQRYPSERPPPVRQQDFEDQSNGDDGDPYGGYEIPPPPQPQRMDIQPTPALNNVLAAFTRGARRRGTDDAEGRELDRERERERERGRLQQMQARQNTREAARRRARPGDIDSVLEEIQDEWAFVTEPEFNPVTLALSLMDNSSAGRSMRSFRRTKQLLEESLKGTIDQNYQNFANALPHHASLLSSLTAVQAEITDSRARLHEARDGLGNKRNDLVQAWSRAQVVEEMLRLLDEVEHLKAVPDTLESLISEKRLLQAAVLLTRSLKLINKGELMELGALTDLRSYLTGQETALREILVEELQNHLYLKVYWCDNRWASYTPGQSRLPDIGSEDGATQARVVAHPKSSPSKLDEFLHDLALRPANENPSDLAETSDLLKSPSQTLAFSSSSLTLNRDSTALGPPEHAESNSFKYIETLLESLAVLGRLGSGLDVVSQRVALEVYSLVESTIDDVRERSEVGKRASIVPSQPPNRRFSNMYVFAEAKSSRSQLAVSLRLAPLEAHSGGMDREPLRDLFWTLYSKLDAVLQGLRVVYEVATRIGSRRDFKDATGAKANTLFSLTEVWTPIQNETCGLLNEYLNVDDRSVTSGRNPIPSVTEMLRIGRPFRENTKSIFRIGGADAKASAKALKPHEQELTRVLKDSVPGLVGAATDSSAQTSLVPANSEDRYASARAHSRLLKADAFHVTVLFTPTLAFHRRVEAILPSGMADTAKGPVNFLNEFASEVYLPQLETKVLALFHNAAGGADAFQEDLASNKLSSKPLVKASTALLALVNSLCALHMSTPFHKEEYSRLILDVIIRFYQICYNRFVQLVALQDGSPQQEETNIAISARWAQKPEVSVCLSALMSSSPSDESIKKRLCRQETRVELNFLTKETVTRADLVPSSRNIHALGTLYHSLSWLITHLYSIRGQAPGDAISPSDAFSPASEHGNEVFTFQPPSEKDKPQLTLTRAMALRYEALLKTYEQLAELVVHTIRVEIRCRIIHFLDLAMRQGNYRLDHEAIEPDPHVIDLNADLASCEDCTTASLPEHSRRFIFEGLGTLMEHLLISNSRHIRFANPLGIEKIFRNILALQQNLKTLSDLPEDAEFARARRYYELYLLTPEALLDTVRERPQYSFEEYKSMLYLRCGIDQTQDEGEVENEEVTMYLIELHGLVVDDWDDTTS